jgi:hypothetical protein
MPGFRLPGEDDRQKQYEEINELINSTPIVQPPNEQEMMIAQQTGQPLAPNEQASIEVDPDVDNHKIEASICRSWLISSAGRLAKQENPEGYKNVLLHMKAHMMIMQQQMMQQQMQQQPQEVSGNAPPAKPKQSEKISGAKDARNPIS